MKIQNPVKAIIVDDDEFCCFQLQDLITKYSLGIEVVGVCNSGEDGLKCINELHPDLVFLDVEMPGMNGFEMLRKLIVANFEIIFTTSHEHYAIRAIRFSALDYLMKPIDPIALQEAVSRLKEKLNTKSAGGARQLGIVGSPAEKNLSNLAVPSLEGLLFIAVQDISHCEGEDKYTKIFLSDKKMILASRTLGDFEEVLLPQRFFRIHKSYLINLNHIKKYIRGEGGQVIMANGAVLDVSRRKKEELIALVTQF